MQHVAILDPLEGAPHQQGLARLAYRGQEALLLEPYAQGLRAHGQGLAALSLALCHSVGGPRLEVEIPAVHPTDAVALGPPVVILALRLPPTESLGVVLRFLPVGSGDVGPAARDGRGEQLDEPPGRLARRLVPLLGGRSPEYGLPPALPEGIVLLGAHDPRLPGVVQEVAQSQTQIGRDGGGPLVLPCAGGFVPELACLFGQLLKDL